ncbi:MAG: poly-beta-1,6-N-acetyl-D-glucosamine biosynthesis protein PgaD [Gallionella sp.]
MKLIIEHPEWQTPKQRLMLGSITLVFWMAWFYLWMPILSIIGWLLGIKLFHYQMIALGGIQEFMGMLVWYAIGIFLLGGSLIAWATYNIRRFKNVNRRRPRKVVTEEFQADYFEVEVNDVRAWRQSQILDVSFDENAQITHVGIEQSEDNAEGMK